MARLRTPFVSGVTTDNPLAIGATTINGAGLAGLPVVASPNTVTLVLDPTGVGGTPEVVHVTAHTAVATSATIVRAREGTVARAHNVGTIFIHAPTVNDFGYTKGPDIASASALVIPDTSADYFNVTGTASISSMTAREGGRRITLKFNSTIVIAHNANIILSGGATISVPAGGVLEFISEDGGIWRQVGLAPAAVSTHEAAGDPHTQYLLESAQHSHSSQSADGSQMTLSVTGTLYDSGSISLIAGTWLIIANITILNFYDQAHSFSFHIRQASTTVAQGDISFMGSSTYGATQHVTLAAIVTPGSTLAYKTSCQCGTNGGSSLNFSGKLRAIKIA